MKKGHKVEVFSKIPLLIESISITVSFQRQIQDIKDEKHLEESSNVFKKLFPSGLKFDIYGFKKQEVKAI